MKKLASSLLFALVAITVSAQTADDVINKYVEAMGGLDKLKSITSVYTESVAVAPNGSEITTKVYRVQDKLYRSEIDFGMMQMVIIITDNGAWFSNPRNGGAFEPIPAERVKNQLHEMDAVGPLVDYAAKGHKAELVGKETIDGVETYNIKLTLKSGNVINYFIDNKNWYVIRTSQKGGGGMFGGGGGPGGGGGGGNRPAGGGEMEMKRDLTNYKKTSDGFFYPMTAKMPGMGGNVLESTVEKVEFNKPVDPKLFKPE